MGVLNTDPAVSLNATFAPTWPPAGNVGMLSQSGALGLAILDYARALNIGMSSFVSVGNKADVSGNDLLVLLGRRPAHAGHRALPRELREPAQVRAHRARRWRARSRSSRSSRGARRPARAPPRATRRRWRASTSRSTRSSSRPGVIRTDTLEELFDVAALLVDAAGARRAAGRRRHQRRRPGHPARRRLRGARPRRCPTLAAATLAALRAFLPAAGGPSANPVDMIASATPEQYARADRGRRRRSRRRRPGRRSTSRRWSPSPRRSRRAIARGAGDGARREAGAHRVHVVAGRARRCSAPGRAGRLPVVQLPGERGPGARRRRALRRAGGARPRGTAAHARPLRRAAPIRAVVDRVLAGADGPRLARAATTSRRCCAPRASTFAASEQVAPARRGRGRRAARLPARRQGDRARASSTRATSAA